MSKGWKRLLIAISVPYFGWWALMAWSGFNTQNYVNEQFAKGDVPEYRQETLFQMSAEASGRIGDAVIFGLVIPIFALIVFGVGFWVYRGFKPKA